MHNLRLSRIARWLVVLTEISILDFQAFLIGLSIHPAAVL
jgi:hypothetical protein